MLIFDEVMTDPGVTVARRSATESPGYDLPGKIVGGGPACGAYGGKREIMDKVAPVGPVPSGHTFGQSAAVAAGMTLLELLDAPGIYEQLEKQTACLCHELFGAVPAGRNSGGG